MKRMPLVALVVMMLFSAVPATAAPRRDESPWQRFIAAAKRIVHVLDYPDPSFPKP